MERYLTEESLRSEGLHVKEIEALLSLHFPKKTLPLNENVLKFVEIFNYLKKLSHKKVRFESSCKLDGDEKPFIDALPFRLTSDQIKVIGEIKKDFLSEYATKRVVMGDVGCGKTMVILSCVIMAYPHKSVLMAPTTVLANQLYEEALRFLPLHVKR